jgi:hypothetical protein
MRCASAGPNACGSEHSREESEDHSFVGTTNARNAIGSWALQRATRASSSGAGAPLRGCGKTAPLTAIAIIARCHDGSSKRFPAYELASTSLGRPQENAAELALLRKPAIGPAAPIDREQAFTGPLRAVGEVAPDELVRGPLHELHPPCEREPLRPRSRCTG